MLGLIPVVQERCHGTKPREIARTLKFALSDEGHRAQPFTGKQTSASSFSILPSSTFVVSSTALPRIFPFLALVPFL